MVILRDPETRPDEDECLIPTSFTTEASRREWEETTAVSWAMTGPPNTEPKEVEAAIRDEFRLRQGDVVVTRHHPQAFLIKFQHRHHCSRASPSATASSNGAALPTAWVCHSSSMSGSASMACPDMPGMTTSLSTSLGGAVH